MNMHLLETRPVQTMGIGGTELLKGSIGRGNRTPIRVFIKPKTYVQEITGARILHKHLSVVHPIYVPPNHAAFPDLSHNSVTLHDAVEDETISTEAVSAHIGEFLSLHIGMWSYTQSSHDKVRVTGYSKKVDETMQATQGYLSTLAWVNGKDATTYSKGFEKVAACVRLSPELHGVSITHGDENWGNVIIRGANSADISTRIVHIDNSSAGYRPWSEALAKMCGWAEVARIQCVLQGKQREANRWEQAEGIINCEIVKRGILNEAELQTSFTAHLVTYLLRELVTWSIPRNGGKSKILLAQAIDAQLAKL